MNLSRLQLDYKAPRLLLDEAKAELAAIPQEELFNSSRYEKSREKWCASMLGLGYEKCAASCRVAVNDTRERLDADVFLETDSREFPFQVVEAMEPERRRGAEYRAFAAGTLRSLAYEPERGHVEGSQWI